MIMMVYSQKSVTQNISAGSVLYFSLIQFLSHLIFFLFHFSFISWSVGYLNMDLMQKETA